VCTSAKKPVMQVCRLRREVHGWNGRKRLVGQIRGGRVVGRRVGVIRSEVSRSVGGVEGSRLSGFESGKNSGGDKGSECFVVEFSSIFGLSVVKVGWGGG
jgi:hypothetical protein